MIGLSDEIYFIWGQGGGELEAVALRDSSKRLQIGSEEFAVLEAIEKSKPNGEDELLERLRVAGTRSPRAAVDRLVSFGVITSDPNRLGVDVFYTPMLYHHMLTDTVKSTAYFSAIRQAVGPGTRLLHAGCGLGLFAVEAALRGATVYAVEQRPIIEVAKRIAHENRVSDRITFVRDDVLAPSLPGRIGRFDVVVSEFVGDEVFDEGILAKSACLKANLLLDASGSKLIPNRLAAYAVPIESSEARDRMAQKMRTFDLSSEAAGMSLGAFREEVERLALANDFGDRLYQGRFSEIDERDMRFLGDPCRFAYLTLDDLSSTLLREEARLVIGSPGRFDGVLICFRLWLNERTSITNLPGFPSLHWPQVIYLSRESTAVLPGAVIRLRVAYFGRRGLIVGFG